MTKIARNLAVTLLLLSSAACSDDEVVGGDEGEITILLTDAPGDFQAAVVTISAIYLQAAEGDEEEDESDGRVYLRTEPITTDLLTLADDLLTLVDGADVAAGTYGQLRFVIDGAYIEVETASGTDVYATPGYAEAPAQVDGELKCPSCSQSGLKVVVPGGLRVEEETTLLVDFDVSASFGHPAGNSGMWIMHPTLRAFEIEAAATVTVSLSLGTGVSLPVIGGSAVTLAQLSAEMKSADAEANVPGEVVAFTDLDGNGTFEASFANVVPGDYVILLRGPAGLAFTTSPAFPHALTVGAGADVQAELTLASAGPSS